MSYWIFEISGIPISCITFQRFTNLEQQTEVWKASIQEYDYKVKDRLNVKSSSLPQLWNVTFTDWMSSMKADPQFIKEYTRLIESDSISHREDIDDNDLPRYIYMYTVCLEVLPKNLDTLYMIIFGTVGKYNTEDSCAFTFTA